MCPTQLILFAPLNNVFVLLQAPTSQSTDTAKKNEKERNKQIQRQVWSNLDPWVQVILFFFSKMFRSI
jgi:hypothetical protein